MFGEIDEKNPQKDPQFDDLSANLPPEPEFLADQAKSTLDDEEQEPVFESAAEETAPAERDDDFQGIELKEFAKREGISVDSLWRRIRAGQLIARTENGFVYVYGTNQPQASEMQTPRVDNNDDVEQVLAKENLPPLPTDIAEDGEYYSNLPVVRQQNHAVAEVALLLDHLTVAKEESKQVLRLSQESISRITQMSEAIVKAKDELIAQQEKILETKDETLSAAEQELAKLKAELSSRDEENRKLRQEVEDLEMLTRTLGGEV